jgi:hypothetical protein
MLPLVNLLHRFHRIDVPWQLVFAHAHNPREAQRISAVVAIAAHDGVERNLQHNFRFDFAQVAVIGRRVGQQPLSQLGDFLVG